MLFLPFLLRPAAEALGSRGQPPMRSLSSSSPSAPGPTGLARQNSTSLTGKPGALPANLDDMKVGGLLRVLVFRVQPPAQDPQSWRAEQNS